MRSTILYLRSPVSEKFLRQTKLFIEIRSKIKYYFLHFCWSKDYSLSKIKKKSYMFVFWYCTCSRFFLVCLYCLVFLSCFFSSLLLSIRTLWDASAMSLYQFPILCNFYFTFKGVVEIIEWYLFLLRFKGLFILNFLYLFRKHVKIKTDKILFDVLT